MIMVEALVQQLATARAPVCPAGPAPSDLREKLVQTDHTELTQVNMQCIEYTFMSHNGQIFILLSVVSSSNVTSPFNVLLLLFFM